MGKPPAMSVSVVLSRKPGGAFVQAVFERWIQGVPECFRDLFGQLEAKGNAFEMFSLGQPFAEPGYQHQVFALLRQPWADRSITCSQSAVFKSVCQSPRVR